MRCFRIENQQKQDTRPVVVGAKKNHRASTSHVSAWSHPPHDLKLTGSQRQIKDMGSLDTENPTFPLKSPTFVRLGCFFTAIKQVKRSKCQDPRTSHDSPALAAQQIGSLSDKNRKKTRAPQRTTRCRSNLSSIDKSKDHMPRTMPIFLTSHYNLTLVLWVFPTNNIKQNVFYFSSFPFQKATGPPKSIPNQTHPSSTFVRV